MTRRGERTVTLTSMPPSLSAVRQQSIAVLPPPITTTRLPMVCTCSKATDVSQSMPMWTLALASLRPGMSRSLPLGAPVPMKTASKPSFSSAARLLISWPKRVSTPKSRMRSISSSSTLTGRRKEGMLVRISPPPFGSFSNRVQL